MAATVDRLDEATWGRIGWNFIGLNVSPALVFDERFSAAQTDGAEADVLRQAAATASFLAVDLADPRSSRDGGSGARRACQACRSEG